MPHYPKPFFKKGRGLWYVEINRKQVNLGPDREEAYRRYHQLMVEPRDLAVPSDSLAGVIDAFLGWVQKNRSASTYEWYRYRLQRLISKYPELKAMTLRPYHVEQWIDDYELSVTSRRNYLRSIKACLCWATKQGYIDKNPIDGLEVPAGERRDVYVPPDEFLRLLEFVPRSDFRDLLVTTYQTGCRPQESLRVTAEFVDLPNGRWVFPQKESKGKHAPRIVYLTDEALPITERLMERWPSGHLFRNTQGRPWTACTANTMFDRIQTRMGQAMMATTGETISDQVISHFATSLKPTKLVGGVTRSKTESELRAEAKRKLTVKRCRELVPRYSLYALRHSWATNALKRGVDPLTVAILMGHKDPSMLARVYQHLSHSPDHMLEQANRASGQR